MGEIIKGRRFFINNTENCLEFSAQSISFALFPGRNLYRWEGKEKIQTQELYIIKPGDVWTWTWDI